MASLLETVKKKIQGQLNKHGSRGSFFGGNMLMIQNERAFISDLAGILTRRLAERAGEHDLVPVIFEVLMKSKTSSKYDLAQRIVEAIEEQV